jgi:N-acetyl-anhydromuramyl-L-alanine amidase AmpD
MNIINVISDMPRKGKWERRTEVDTAVIHHSVGPSLPKEGTLQHLKNIANYHIREKGDISIAYHYVIDGNGNVYQTNDVYDLTWHGHGSNTTGIGICLLGDFTEAPPNDTQLAAARGLVHLLQLDHGISKVIGHRQAPRANTACPGKAFTNKMIMELLSDNNKSVITSVRWNAEEVVRTLEKMNLNDELKAMRLNLVDKVITPLAALEKSL